MVRHASRSDLPIILITLREVLRKSPSAFGLGGSLHAADEAICEAIGDGRAFIHDNVFFFFDIGKLWYSEDLTLFEQLVLKLGPMQGTLEEVVATFDGIAKDLGCIHIVAGDSQQGRMVSRYEAAGYRHGSVQLHKRVG